MQQDDELDIAIVGAGPAGLAAAAACEAAGVSFELIEAGTTVDLRDHNLQSELGRGVGGAGLFSDGKFSYYPSATQLWSLVPDGDLQESYAWACELLRRHQISAPVFPAADMASFTPTASVEEELIWKSYPSHYATLEQRLKLIRELQNVSRDHLVSKTKVVELEVTGGQCRAKIIGPSGNVGLVISKSMILTAGRFGPILLQEASNIPTCFQRLEVGVRIEQEQNMFFLSQRQELDPKLKFSDHQSGLEWRTFCCCRNGEMVAIEDSGFYVLSGRSDVEPTDRCNIGFHVRFLRTGEATTVLEEIRSSLASTPGPRHMPLSEFVGSALPECTPVGKALGRTAALALREGLLKLSEAFGPNAMEGASVHAPTVEGVAYYPMLGPDLRVPSMPIWAAGDVTGMFRGLVAALVSGHFAAGQSIRVIGADV